MSIRVFIELNVKLEKLDCIQSLFSNLLHETRSRTGNEGVNVYSDQDSPTTIVLVEQWTSRRLYEEYNQWRLERGDLSRLSDLLIYAPKRRFFDFLLV